ncbi:MAG: protein phosphatase 2C domain-containing protein, partial [Dehalococcoidia bacterium]|nr:protein phosphatase 2C domain-containing protein [Dehalococcoidia bacterium]
TESVPALLVVADGIGGAAAGEIASAEAVEEFTRVFQGDSGDLPLPDRLREATQRANRRVHDLGQSEGRYRGMGSTLVAAAIHGDHLWVANVGDSRCYRIREGTATQLTEDHSWAAEQVRAGLATEQEATIQVSRHVITRSLGAGPDVEVDVIDAGELLPGDAVLLCSDGLSGVVQDAEIAQAVASLPLKESVQHLVELANRRGGPDNISVVVARASMEAEAEPEAPVPAPPGMGRISLASAALAVSAVLGALAVGLLVGLVCAPSGGGSPAATDVPAAESPAAPAGADSEDETPEDGAGAAGSETPPEGEDVSGAGLITCEDGVTEAEVHVVQSGDTLSSISDEANVSVDAIVACDPVIVDQEDTLTVDQEVAVPVAPAEGEQPAE